MSGLRRLWSRARRECSTCYAARTDLAQPPCAIHRADFYADLAQIRKAERLLEQSDPIPAGADPVWQPMWFHGDPLVWPPMVILDQGAVIAMNADLPS